MKLVFDKFRGLSSSIIDYNSIGDVKCPPYSSYYFTPQVLFCVEIWKLSWFRHCWLGTNVSFSYMHGQSHCLSEIFSFLQYEIQYLIKEYFLRHVDMPVNSYYQKRMQLNPRHWKQSTSCTMLPSNWRLENISLSILKSCQ